MAVKNPIGIDANGDLYEMDATDLATKNPICLYSGELKELQSGDTLPGGGGGTDPIIREYTANATWTKPAGLHSVMAIMIGAGGGGGSGRRATGNIGGGGGGGGGAAYYRIIAAADLSSTESITIGAAGIGAAAQTVDNTNGIDGTDGGDTSFSTYTAGGGKGGGAGTSSTSVNNRGASGQPDIAQIPFGYNGSIGGRGNYSSSSLGRDGAAGGLSTCGAGGGGGGARSSATIIRNAGDGGGMYLPGGTSVAGGVGSTTDGVNGGNGTDDVHDRLHFVLDNDLSIGLGTAGAGGAQGDNAGTIAGGDGGDGGKAAGGGGGGCSRNGVNSGAGGDGGQGFVILIEYYGA